MYWGQESGVVVLVISLYLLCMQISFVVASTLSYSGSGPILFNLPYFFLIHTVSPSSLIFRCHIPFFFPFRCLISLPYFDGFYQKASRLL